MLDWGNRKRVSFCVFEKELLQVLKECTLKYVIDIVRKKSVSGLLPFHDMI